MGQRTSLSAFCGPHASGAAVLSGSQSVGGRLTYTSASSVYGDPPGMRTAWLTGNAGRLDCASRDDRASRNDRFRAGRASGRSRLAGKWLPRGATACSAVVSREKEGDREGTSMAPILVGERFKRYSNASPPNGPCDPRPEEDQASVLTVPEISPHRIPAGELKPS